MYRETPPAISSASKGLNPARRGAAEEHTLPFSGEVAIFEHESHSEHAPAPTRAAPPPEDVRADRSAVQTTESAAHEAELRRRIAELEELVGRQESEIVASQEQLLLSEHLAATGMLASGLGHDIANTLLPMRLRLESLERLCGDEKIKRDLEAIRESMEHFRRLSNSLRQLVRDSDDTDASRHAIDISEWWRNVGPLLTKAVPRGVRIEQNIGEGLPRAAIAEHQLTQAMLNVISNAGDATQGGGCVRISAERSHDDAAILLRVADDGLGMPPEVARRLMQPFFTSKTRRFTTGLGLYVVRGIVKRAGGSIVIETAPGRGTTVTLQLPIADLTNHSPSSGEGLLAFVTLRDSRLAAYAATLLAASGYEVVEGSSEEFGRPLLLVCDTDDASFTRARARQSSAPARMRIIALGADPSGRWSAIGALVVDPAEGAAAFRTALRHALEKKHDHRSHS